MDGYGSHLTYEFIEYATKNNILLHTFPPHFTHILQPLVAVVFQPYKHYHSKAVSQAVRDGATDLNKLDFLGSLRDIRKQTIKTSTILSAFEKTGIVPLNPSAVLSRVPENHEDDPKAGRNLERPKTPPQPLPYDLENVETPKSVRQLGRHVQELEEAIWQHPDGIPSHIKTGVSKLGRAALSAQNSYILACRDLGRTRLAENLRDARKRQPNRQIQTGETINYEDGRHMKRKRDNDDIEQENRRQQRFKENDAAASALLDHQPQSFN